MLAYSPFILKGSVSPSFNITFSLHFPHTHQNYTAKTRIPIPNTFTYNIQKSARFPRKLPSRHSMLRSYSNDFTIANNSSKELELLEKPTAVVPKEEHTVKNKSNDDAENMASYMNVFSAAPYLEEDTVYDWQPNEGEDLEFYDPKVGDLVLGVVVSGNAHRMDINIGSDVLATMLRKEALPLYDDEMERLLCEVPNERTADAEEHFAPGKVGIVKDKDALSPGPPPGRPVVDVGTVLCAEVLGRTLGGKPLLSSRRVTRRIAWQRVRQIKQLNEPIDVCISEWNTGGLITRIEGLRAFLPKIELVNKPYDSFAALKTNVGRQISVLINRVDAAKGDLLISEREAWDMKYLKEGTLLEGSIRRIYSYGAEVRVDGTSISGLLHISNISHVRVPSVEELFSEGEKVKVMAIHSMFTNKISFSTAELEREKGLILKDKQKVFNEAEKMAAAYRQKFSSLLSLKRRNSSSEDVHPREIGGECYANWNWIEFEREIAV